MLLLERYVLIIIFFCGGGKMEVVRIVSRMMI